MVLLEDKLRKLIKIWLMYASRSILIWFLGTWSGIVFIIGKTVRFLLYFIFIFVVLSSSNNLVGYNREQVIFFYLVFNLIDVMVQFLFRGVYVFRQNIVSGNYDLDLLKPLPSFFRPIFGWTDIMDFITLIPLTILFIWFVISNHLSSNLLSVIIFILLFVNSMVIAFALHLFISGICVITTEIDQLMGIYRDITSMARFPTDIYGRGIQAVLTFVLPVVVLVTVPAKALMGLLSWQWVVFSLLIGVIFLWGSLRFWKYALRQYSSASS